MVLNMNKVYIVYRVVPLPNSGKYRKVEAIFSEVEHAERFAESAHSEWDTKFGIDIQEWILDDPQPPKSLEDRVAQIEGVVEFLLNRDQPW